MITNDHDASLEHYSMSYLCPLDDDVGEGDGLDWSDPTDISDTELAGEKGANSDSLS